MSNASLIRLVPLLRRLFDSQIDQEDKDRKGPEQAKNRRQTPWELGVELLLAEFQVLGIGKPDLREHLLRLRFAGIDPLGPLTTDGKTGKDFQIALRGVPLGGVDSVSPLSAELARLDSAGFAVQMIERLRLSYPDELSAILDLAKENHTGKTDEGDTTLPTGPEAEKSTGSKGFSTPIPREEANVLVRQYLKDDPKATARDVAKCCKIALGRVSTMPAWQAHQANKRDKARSTNTRTTRQLTEAMLESIGKVDNPAAHIEKEEAAWAYLLENARTPEERARLNSMTGEEKAAAIGLVIEDFEDRLEQEGRHRR